MSWKLQPTTRSASQLDIKPIYRSNNASPRQCLSEGMRLFQHNMITEAFDFLKKNKEVAFATVRNGQPSIRIFQIMKMDGAALYFATHPHKEVYSQMVENPSVEILAYKNNVQVRMAGEISFDVPVKIRQEIFNTNPILSDLYPNFDTLVYGRMDVKFVEYFDLTPRPPRIERYKL